MTLGQIRIFVVVAELEHMTRAAAALHIAQSAVSAAIGTLEADLGLKLFERVGRNIRLTSCGAAFRDEALDLLDHAERLARWVAAFKVGEAGETSQLTAHLALDQIGKDGISKG